MRLLPVVLLAACAHTQAQVAYLAPDGVSCPTVEEHASLGLPGTEAYAAIMATPVAVPTDEDQVSRVVEQLPRQIASYRDALPDTPAAHWASACTLGVLSAALSNLQPPDAMTEAERRSWEEALTLNVHPLVLEVRSDARSLAAVASTGNAEWSPRAHQLAEDLEP